MINSAMIFSAGLGTRFKPLTDTIPKPLVKVNNIPLIDYNIELLKQSGIKNIIINSFYLAEILEKYLAEKFPEVKIIREEERLETGGGLINAASKFQLKTLITANSDIVFPDYKIENPVKILQQNWDEKKFDMLLLLAKTEDFIGYQGNGDFSFDDNGKIEKKPKNEFVYTGLQVINATILQNYPKKIFSLSEIFNQSLAKNRLGGIVYGRKVLHIGDLKGLEAAENYLNSKK